MDLFSLWRTSVYTQRKGSAQKTWTNFFIEHGKCFQFSRRGVSFPLVIRGEFHCNCLVRIDELLPVVSQAVNVLHFFLELFLAFIHAGSCVSWKK